MKINMKTCLVEFIKQNIPINEESIPSFQLPDIEINPADIKVLMISEVPPQDNKDYFYSKMPAPYFMKTTLPLFQKAGVGVKSIDDIIRLGIYITTAVKTPKTGYNVDAGVIKDHLPILKYELSLFDNLKAIMLMGDVAKKTFNLLAKQKTGKNVIPPGSTYKLRLNKYYYNGIRVFPSYIMTGGNILIEKSKRDMITDDIRQMIEII